MLDYFLLLQPAKGVTRTPLARFSCPDTITMFQVVVFFYTLVFRWIKQMRYEMLIDALEMLKGGFF